MWNCRQGGTKDKTNYLGKKRNVLEGCWWLIIREGAGKLLGLRGSGIPLSASPVSGHSIPSPQSGFFTRWGARPPSSGASCISCHHRRNFSRSSNTPVCRLEAQITHHTSHPSMAASVHLTLLSSEKASVVSWAAIPEPASQGGTLPWGPFQMFQHWPLSPFIQGRSLTDSFSRFTDWSFQESPEKTGKY